MSLSDGARFGLRLARLIIETRREPLRDLLNQSPEWLQNEHVDASGLRGAGLVLLVRKTDGAVRFVIQLGMDDEDTADSWVFKWPTSPGHDVMSICKRIDDILNA